MTLLALDRAVVALSETRELAPIDLVLAPGELLALLGRNGSGKSSLVRAASGITRLTSGTLTVRGRVVDARTDRKALARDLSYLPQGESSAETELSVDELLELGRAPHTDWLGRMSHVDRVAMREARSACELEALRTRRLDSLSMGERQRAHLGRCIAQDTAVMLLDEPTASMDPVHAIDLLRKVKERVAGQERAALVVMHDLMLAARFADRVMMLGDDRVLALGPPREVLTRAVLREGLGIDADVEMREDEVVLRVRST